MSFKKVKATAKSYVSSAKGDLNNIINDVKSIDSKIGELGNKFDQRIADGLSDLLTGLTGIRVSNIPEISAEVLDMKGKNREARAAILNDPSKGRSSESPSNKIALTFPKEFRKEDGTGQPLTNYIHFRSLDRNVKDHSGEDVYDIFLYVPDTLQDNVSVTYKEAEKGIVEGIVGQIFNEEGAQTSSEELGNIIISGAPGGDLLRQAAGKTVNPLKFQLFEGVNFRTYSYTFNLRPKNADDAQSIQEIIHAFKLSALPGTIGANKRIYTFPNEWAIRFRGPFKDHIDYPLVSVCTGVEVNYTDGQSFSTFIDGAPTSVGLTLNFTETSTLTRDKYKNRSSAFLNVNSDAREQSQEMGSDLVTTNEQKRQASEKARKEKEAKAKEKKAQETRTEPSGTSRNGRQIGAPVGGGRQIGPPAGPGRDI